MPACVMKSDERKEGKTKIYKRKKEEKVKNKKDFGQNNDVKDDCVKVTADSTNTKTENMV